MEEPIARPAIFIFALIPIAIYMEPAPDTARWPITALSDERRPRFISSFSRPARTRAAVPRSVRCSPC
jgi:hypothetical protein